MSIFNTEYDTLMNVAANMDSSGKISKILDLMTEMNPMLGHMKAKPGNLAMGHEQTIGVGQPEAYIRKVNRGTKPSTTKEIKIREEIACFEAWCEIDVEAADASGNQKLYRMNKAPSFIQSVAQKAAEISLYGNEISDGSFVGLLNRINSTTAGNSHNLINAGGSGNTNASILMCAFGPGLHGILPKNSKNTGTKKEASGTDGRFISHENKGIVIHKDNLGRSLELYTDVFKLKIGLMSADWRDFGAIRNIDIPTLIADQDGTAINLQNMMLQLTHRVGTAASFTAKGKDLYIYMPRIVYEIADIQSVNKKNILFASGTGTEGERIIKFRGIPVYPMDAMITNEETVV